MWVGIKWAIIAGTAVVLAVAGAWVWYNWDDLVFNFLAPWARKNNHRGLLIFLVQVDRWVVGLCRVVVRFGGRKGEPLLATPVIVVERVVREQDLPPELRLAGEHQQTLNVEN